MRKKLNQLKAVPEKKNVYSRLPTGFGKLLIFSHLAGCCWGSSWKRASDQQNVVLISPDTIYGWPSILSKVLGLDSDCSSRSQCKPQEVFQSVECGKFVLLFALPDAFNQWLFGGRCGRSSPNSTRSVVTIRPQATQAMGIMINWGKSHFAIINSLTWKK